MINEEQIEKLVERLTQRMQKANELFLEKVGSSLKKIRELTPSKAQELIQILKYGGDYNEIIKQIGKYTNLNAKDIEKIFSAYAKKDRQFARKFYEYRNLPFKESLALTRQLKTITEIAKNELYNFTRSNVLGYTINGKFFNLRDTYNQLLDEAFVNVGQGKETFNQALYRILKDIGGSGLRTIEYESGRSIRLDSAISMHLKGRLRELHNEEQKIIGEEIGADGIEISVHGNPAIDHEQAQGRQFSLKEYEKLSSGLPAKDYKGKVISLDHDANGSFRPISEMNCYHYIFSIILGVNEPEYTDDQLQEIIDRNNEGFMYNGKHYTMYEGTQLQRAIEREVRKQKDIQILARESGNDDLVGESQRNITILTNKYRELVSVSGLPTKMDRMRVSGYRRIKA